MKNQKDSQGQAHGASPAPTQGTAQGRETAGGRTADTPRQAARPAGGDADDTAPDRLSPHFTLQEMTRSGEAIRRNIDNQPDAESVRRLRLLCLNVLEHLRRRVGRVLVTSGYRSKRLNQAVGGAPTSQHCLGEAADLYVSSTEQARKYADIIAAGTDFDQLITEPRGERRKRWVHVSFTARRRNRRQRLS